MHIIAVHRLQGPIEELASLLTAIDLGVVVGHNFQDRDKALLTTLSNASDSRGQSMETIKTATFESLIELAKENPDGGYTFVLDGTSYQIGDVLEISAIATRHGYIVIY